MKRIRIKALKAIKKGYLKEGDKFYAEVTLVKILDNDFALKFTDSQIISIPKPEPKPIDFGKAGLVLKGEFSIIQTTGFCGTECFSGIYLNGNCTKGFTSNGFIKDQNMWEDITETYYLNNPK
jgi:hypothetical protein